MAISKDIYTVRMHSGKTQHQWQQWREGQKALNISRSNYSHMYWVSMLSLFIESIDSLISFKWRLYRAMQILFVLDGVRSMKGYYTYDITLKHIWSGEFLFLDNCTWQLILSTFRLDALVLLKAQKNSSFHVHRSNWEISTPWSYYWDYRYLVKQHTPY